MGILITEVRIKNFRSLESIDIKLELINILIGQNNCGKSNFLKAIDIALNGSGNVSEEDIYVRNSEHLSKDKNAIIDFKIVPIDEDNRIVRNFNDFWTGVFTDRWITIDETNGDFVGIRTVIEYDIKKNDYVISRKSIKEWNDSIDLAKVGKRQQFTSDMHDYINGFYMDAHRDITVDIKDRKSYFGKATSQENLSQDKIDELEEQLNIINGEIINNITALKQTTEKISKIGETLGNSGSKVQIDPLSRKLSDLHKGMDITFKDGNAAGFSISQHGMGTKSWVSFLTLGAYVDYFHSKIKEDDEEADDYVMLTLEEPEAHLHPHAQRQLYEQLIGFTGQKIVSTHSPNVLMQAKLDDIIHFYKIDGKTYAKRFNTLDYKKEDINKIYREVIKSRGELLFSNAIILCEGITEEQALPIYFKEYFGDEAIFKGINIIGVDGQNYKTFLNLIKDFDIGWYIFSDGEELPMKGVKNAVKIMTDKKLEELENVVLLEKGYDFEKYLIKSGYNNEIITAINKYNENDSYFEGYTNNLNGKVKTHRVRTDKPPCPECKQFIYEDVVDGDESGLNTDESNIYRCITAKKAKARYAIPIAEEIISNSDVNRRIPSKILALFKVISQDYKIKAGSEYCETESIAETTENS